MKLSFTTLGCPDWDLETIIASAKEYGYDGIDFRGLQGNMNVFEMSPFAGDYKQTRETIEQAGLAVSCFSSSINLVSAERGEQNMEELKRYAELCEKFGTRYIRAFGGKRGGKSREEAVAIAGELFGRMAPILHDAGVQLIVETHDDWTRCEDMVALLEGTSPETIGVLWDIHHPNRTVGELPEQTWAALGSRIAYTHWKDSRLDASDPSKFKYQFMGEGDIPLADIYKVLQANGYDGWYTFEWEKRWHPDLAEPEAAFPQYVRFMRELERSQRRD